MTIASVAAGLSPSRTEFDNGVVAIAQRSTTIPAVAINATFTVGSACDSSDLPGRAYLTGRAIDRGTRAADAGAIADALDERGVSLRVKVTRHTFRLSCTCLAEDLSSILALVADIARNPVFPHRELEKRRNDALTSLRQDADNPAVRSVEAMLTLLYGQNHPYARPAKGTPATLEGMSRDDLVQFHQEELVPPALRVALVGDLEQDLAIALIASHFSDWPGGPADPVIVPPPPPRSSRQTAVVNMPGKSQSDIAYGFAAVSRHDPRYCAYWLMNNILGQFGLGGRLADNIRERQGMAYYAFSTFEGTVGQGPLVVRAGVDPHEVERAIVAIDAEVSALRRDGPTADEVEETRQSLVGSIPRLLETNESIAAFLQTAERFGLGLDYERRLPGILSEVTIDDVRQAAHEILDPAVAAVAIAGPHESGSPL